MAKADLTTFNLQYETWCADRLGALPNVSPFEFFCADQFLKDRCLSDSEILAGQVDGGNDGGVDSIYIFFNGILLDDNLEVDSRAGGLVEIKIIQSKTGKGFSPAGIEKIQRFLEDLLSFNRKEEDYIYQYHSDLMKQVQNFKEKFKELRSRSTPHLDIEIFYVTKLDVNEAGINAKKAADKLVLDSNAYYSECTIRPVQFVGAERLWLQFRVAAPKKKSIPLEQSFSTKEGWVALVTLSDFFDFLKDTDGVKIDESIFDANVRGYQLASGVNARISKTLQTRDREFWQLNNGITILSPKASYSDEHLEIDNPQIVNGLQTSRRIFEHFASHGSTENVKDSRRLLIRVIKTDDEITKSEIIRATNDQNTMPMEAFLSTLKIQHQIEEYFGSKGFYYERRKGHYKSLNKPADQIVEMLELIQALIAVVRKEPEVSRGAPRNYLKDKKRILLFGSDEDSIDRSHEPLDLDVYLRSVEIMRMVRKYLSNLGLNRPTIKNLQGFVALDLVTTIIGNANFQSYEVASIDPSKQATNQVFHDSFDRVWAVYQYFGGNDKAVKSKVMADELRNLLKKQYSPKKTKGEKAYTTVKVGTKIAQNSKS